METAIAESEKIKPLVILLDPDPEFSEITAQRLDEAGCRVHLTQKVEAFLDLIKIEKPQLVLMDIRLGPSVVDGFSLLQRLRGPLGFEPPILIISELVDPASISRVLELGANDFLSKPPLRPAFLSKLSEYLRTENLGEPDVQRLMEVDPVKQHAWIDFKVRLIEVGPTELVLMTSHLVRKGTAFKVSGPLVEEIFNGKKELLLVATVSAMVLNGDRREFRVQAEIDSTDTGLRDQLKHWLSQKRVS